MSYLFTSKKSKSMGLPLALWALLGGLVATYFGVPSDTIGSYFIMMGLVVGGHMIAYGLSDAASIMKDGNKKS